MPSRMRPLLLVAATMALSSPAMASRDTETDMLSIGKAVVSLTHAISTAERYVNGHATQAHSDSIAGGSLYTVQVAKGDQLFNIVVDVDKGLVLSIRPDHEIAHGDTHNNR